MCAEIPDEPVWIEQRIDLTRYAGKKVLLRFEYVTDGALNDHGFAIDDVEIPEVGYRDDAESETGWESNGFIRSTNTVQQRYVVQVVRFGERPTVDRHVAIIKTCPFWDNMIDMYGKDAANNMHQKTIGATSANYYQAIMKALGLWDEFYATQDQYRCLGDGQCRMVYVRRSAMAEESPAGEQ